MACRLETLAVNACFVTTMLVVGCRGTESTRTSWTRPGEIFRPRNAEQADLQIAFAQLQESRGAADEAIRSYQDAIKNDSQRADAHWRLAVLLDQQGRIAESEQYFLEALRQEPQNAELATDYAYHLYVSQRWSAAEKKLRAVLKDTPQHQRAHNILGLVLAAQGRNSDALQEFAAAGCSRAEAHSNLAVACSLAGRLDESREAFALAVAADPGLNRAREGLISVDAALATHRSHTTPMVADQRPLPRRAGTERPLERRQPGHSIHPITVVSGEQPQPAPPKVAPLVTLDGLAPWSEH